MLLGVEEESLGDLNIALVQSIDESIDLFVVEVRTKSNGAAWIYPDPFSPCNMTIG